MVDEVDLGVELDELVLVQSERGAKTERNAQRGSHHSYHEALRKENSAYRARRHSHRLEDADLFRLVSHDHRQRAHYVERGDEHDEEQNHAHT